MHQGSTNAESDPPEGDQKRMRVFSFCQKRTERTSYQTLRRETNGCKFISHPNLLPVIDVSETLFPFCIMSPWMPDGNIRQYLQANPNANRLTLVRVNQLGD
jgi:serine/threonine protein kinase